MKQLFALLLCCTALLATAQQKNKFPFEKIAGHWEMKKANGKTMGEIWVKKSDNEMSGKSYLVKNGDSAWLESVQLIEKGDNTYYIPVAYGQNDGKPVPFKLTAANGTEYIFENTEHDFPKRIVYDFKSNDELHAYIDDGTANKRQHYNYKRKK